MAQITIYLDKELEEKMRARVKAQNTSQSRWIADLIRENLRDEWPQEVLELAGAWKDDFPDLEEIRVTEVDDMPRESI